MRRLCADREEKRVTRGSDISGQGGEQEQLDLNDPNQRSDRTAFRFGREPAATAVLAVA